MSSDPAAERVRRFQEAVEGLSAAATDLLSGPIEGLESASIDSLVGSAARVFTVAQEIAPEYQLDAEAISPTEALTLVGALMGAHNINAFDLALWLSHAGAGQDGQLMGSTAQENR